MWVLREVSARGGTVRWGETTSKTKYLLASSGNSSGGDIEVPGCHNYPNYGALRQGFSVGGDRGQRYDQTGCRTG